ncbi:uncharacterized protein LOC144822736 isoform X2 [Lissotriton helveticus]
MPPQGSGQAPVAFCDVAAHFSEEEWELLHEWQKELYRNVMKEIHQALKSLGPLIATSVFSLRPKEKNELRSALLPNLQTEGSSLNPPSSHGDVSPVVPLIVKEEGGGEDTYSIDLYDHERRESAADVTQFPFCNIEQEECLAEYHQEREESSACPNTGPDDSNPATSIGINEEGQTYSFSNHGYRKQLSINNSGSQGRMKRKSKGEEPEQYPNKNIQCAASSGKVKVIKKSKQITSSKSQLWSDRNLKLGVVQSENECVNKLQSRLQQSNPKVGKMTNPNYLWLAQPFVGQTNSTEHRTTKIASSSKERHFQCTECNKSFIQKVHLIRHQRTHSGERPYHCTECEKSFSQKHHLLGHLRTHSGEKPFQCAKCMKRFCWKEGLYRHQRTHVCPMHSYT